MVGAVISFTTAVALFFPGSFPYQMWKLNPRAQQGFAKIGVWAVVLMLTVSAGCGLSAFGLWNGKLWGYRLAIALLITNLVGDVYNVISRTEPRAAVGIPIVILILVFTMNRSARGFFQK